MNKDIDYIVNEANNLIENFNPEDITHWMKIFIIYYSILHDEKTELPKDFVLQFFEFADGVYQLLLKAQESKSEPIKEPEPMINFFSNSRLLKDLK